MYSTAFCLSQCRGSRICGQALGPLESGALRAFHPVTHSLIHTHTCLSSELSEPLPLAPAELQGMPGPSPLQAGERVPPAKESRAPLSWLSSWFGPALLSFLPRGSGCWKSDSLVRVLAPQPLAHDVQ